MVVASLSQEEELLCCMWLQEAEQSQGGVDSACLASISS